MKKSIHVICTIYIFLLVLFVSIISNVIFEGKATPHLFIYYVHSNQTAVIMITAPRAGSNYTKLYQLQLHLFFISITIAHIIFQINYSYTVSITITLCGIKYIQHLLIMYFCTFC